MKAYQDSSESNRRSVNTEATLAEELGGFRVGIAQWAAAYVDRGDATAASEKWQKAAVDLRGWSRDYFRAT